MSIDPFRLQRFWFSSLHALVLDTNSAHTDFDCAADAQIALSVTTNLLCTVTSADNNAR